MMDGCRHNISGFTCVQSRYCYDKRYSHSVVIHRAEAMWTVTPCTLSALPVIACPLGPVQHKWYNLNHGGHGEGARDTLAMSQPSAPALVELKAFLFALHVPSLIPKALSHNLPTFPSELFGILSPQLGCIHVGWAFVVGTAQHADH